MARFRCGERERGVERTGKGDRDTDQMTANQSLAIGKHIFCHSRLSSAAEFDILLIRAHTLSILISIIPESSGFLRLYSRIHPSAHGPTCMSQQQLQPLVSNQVVL